MLVPKVPTLKEAIELVTDMSADLASRCDEAEGRIKECFEDVAGAVEQRKRALLTELETVHGTKQGTLAHQRALLESCVANVSNSCQFTEEALARGNPMEVLLVKKQMADTLAQYSAMQVDIWRSLRRSVQDAVT